jgi:hypothetical protein
MPPSPRRRGCRARGRPRAPGSDRRHPLVSADLVAASGGSAAVVAAIAAHHERLDGSGYPVGLAGDGIGAGRAGGCLGGWLRDDDPRDHPEPRNSGRRRLPPLRIVTRGRFDDRAVIALADIVGGGTAGISGGFGRSASH